MKKSTFLLVAITILSVLCFSCGSVEVPEKEGWTLIWNDEFTGKKLDTTKWDYQIGTGSQYGLNGWGNDEVGTLAWLFFHYTFAGRDRGQCHSSKRVHDKVYPKHLGYGKRNLRTHDGTQ